MTVIFVILGIIAILFLGQTTITFAPFSFHMEALANVIGVLFLGIALSCFSYQTTKETKKEIGNTEYLRGYEDGKKTVEKVSTKKDKPVKDERKND